MALHHLCQPLPAWHRCYPTVSTNGVGTAVVVGRARVAAGRTRVGVATICSGSGATGSRFLSGSGATQAHSSTSTTPTPPQGYFFTCQTLPLLSHLPASPYLWRRHGPPAANKR